MLGPLRRCRAGAALLASRQARRTATMASLSVWLTACAASSSLDASVREILASPPGIRGAVGPSTPDLAGPVRLSDLLPLLLERNPEILEARARLEAAAQRYPQAISLADPMVEATYYTRNAMDPSGSFPRYNLMVRQEFPLPIVLSLRGSAATKEAEAEALRYEAAVRDAVAMLKDIEAERAYLDGAEGVQSATRDIYRRYAELARADTELGRTRLPEAFRAEALLAQAGYELTVIGEIRDVEDRRLRALLALPPGTPIGRPADAAAVPRLEVDLDALSRRALAYNQELREAGIEVEVAALGVRTARWQFAPRFSIGAGRMVNDKFDAASGRTTDSTVVSFGLSLPIWYSARSAGVREAEARERAVRASQAGQRERILADVARTGFRLRNASRLAELYGSELVPQAEKALVRSQSMMQEGKESLASSLELAATWQQLRIAGLRSAADAVQAAAALERLLGASLESAPAADAEGAPR